ncbi:MAG: class I SAM-dependent methyltransferase, partial [Pseudomonadota bacterium]
DVGCGAGFYALEAKKRGLIVHAVDMSPQMVKKLENQVDKVHVFDIESIPTEQKFDRVICAGVLDFVKNPELAFSNLCQLVAPGGRLVVLCPRQGLGGLYYRCEKYFVGIRVNLFKSDWLSSLASKHGLKLAQISYPLPTNMALLFTRTSS